MIQTLDRELNVAASAALQQRGCVHLIGLGEIQNQIGGRWERLKQMVWTRLDNLLRQQLGPTDFHVRINELAFLVSLPSLSQPEAEVFCLRIAHELQVELLGNCQPADLQVFRIVRHHENTLETEQVPPGDFNPAAPAARRNAPPQLLVPRIGGGQGRPGQELEIHHRFMPIWDARKQAIASYRCLSLFDQSLAENLGMEQRTRFDLSAALARIANATAELSRGLESGGKFLLWIPITYDLLASPAARTKISAACRELNVEQRSYIVFEISDLPFGVPQSRLFDLISALKPYCRGIVAQLPARIANYGAYLGAGLQAIGLSLLAGGVSGTEMESEIFKLRTTARRQHIMSFVFDIPNEELLQAAHQQGVNFLSSSLIGLPLETPAPAHRLLARDISKLASHVDAA
jgi:hypothetical protein